MRGRQSCKARAVRANVCSHEALLQQPERCSVRRSRLRWPPRSRRGGSSSCSPRRARAATGRCWTASSPRTTSWTPYSSSTAAASTAPGGSHTVSKDFDGCFRKIMYLLQNVYTKHGGDSPLQCTKVASLHICVLRFCLRWQRLKHHSANPDRHPARSAAPAIRLRRVAGGAALQPDAGAAAAAIQAHRLLLPHRARPAVAVIMTFTLSSAGHAGRPCPHRCCSQDGCRLSAPSHMLNVVLSELTHACSRRSRR